MKKNIFSMDVVPAVRVPNMAQITMSRTTAAASIDIRKVEEIVVSRAHPCDLPWLRKGYVPYLIRGYMSLVDPRLAIVDKAFEINNEETIADTLLQMIGTESFEELEHRAEVDNDPAAMLKLGDFLMLAIKMENNDLRDPVRACSYYYRSASQNYPEGRIAQAMLYYKIMTQELKSVDGKMGMNMVHIPQNKQADPLYKYMWNNLEYAAQQNFICPFLIMMVELHDNPKFELPPNVRRCYFDRMDDVARQKNRCCYADCHTDPENKGYKLLTCASCRCRKYCR